MTDLSIAVGTPGQRLYRELLVGSLIYSVVLGFFDSYTSVVETRSYSVLFLASIVLELLTIGAFRIKDRIIVRFRYGEGARSKAAMGLGVWFVMFSSKFVFIWVIDLVFGDDVNVNGFFGILLVVASVTVLHRLAGLVDAKLAVIRPGDVIETGSVPGFPRRGSGNQAQNGDWAMRPPLAEVLDLQPHPEGGWFRETWRAAEQVHTDDGRDRATGTLILFLLPAGESSAWHRVASDEVWLAHRGEVELELGGNSSQPRAGVVVLLGIDVEEGQRPQVLVTAGTWQRTLPSDTDALVSCVVSPGFDFDDFELVADEP